MTNKTRKVALTVSAFSTLWAANPALAQESETIRDLKSQVQELDQKLRVVERRLELEHEASSEKSKSAPVISAGAGGFSFRSADTNFVLKIRGYVQADSRWFVDDNGIDGNDTFLLRRVRPIFEGTVFDKYDFRVMLDFGSGATTSAANNGLVQDAYLNARFLPEFQLQFGKFKEPVGLERLQSGANLLFVERAYPTLLLPNRDVGVQLHGELFSGTLSYAVGIFNGVPDGGSGDFETADDEKDGAARLFAQPFRNADTALKGLGIGIAGTYGNQEGALRSFVSPGQQRFFAYRTSTAATAPNVEADGDHIRLTPQGYYYWGPLGIYGEYAISSQDVRQVGGGAGAGSTAELRHTAWQVAASWVLTGEENSWRGITPKRPFNLSGGGWGAWEVAARYSELDVDDDAFPIFANPDTSATSARSWTIGVNWHLNRNVKFNLNYEETDFEGGPDNLITAQKEHAILTRAQVSF